MRREVVGVRVSCLRIVQHKEESRRLGSDEIREKVCMYLRRGGWCMAERAVSHEEGSA
jgi:hypothetical protein